MLPVLPVVAVRTYPPAAPARSVLLIRDLIAKYSQLAFVLQLSSLCASRDFSCADSWRRCAPPPVPRTDFPPSTNPGAAGCFLIRSGMLLQRPEFCLKRQRAA